MRIRNSLRLGSKALLLAMGLLLGAMPSWGQTQVADPGDDLPSAQRMVKFRLGAVDAVNGDIHVRLPLSPQLPGRIPFGFTYFFDSLDPLHLQVCGDFRPVVWPGFSAKRYMYTVIVGGETLTFYLNAKPTTPLNTNFQSLLNQREGSDGNQDAINEGQPYGVVPDTFQSAYYPSADGTKFFIISWWTMKNSSTGQVGNAQGGRRYTVVDGSNTIWTAYPDPTYSATPRGVSHFQTLWGDHVSVTENQLTYPQPPGYLSPVQTSINGSIVIKNERDTGQTITLSVTGNTSTATLTVTSSATLGFPKTTLSGYCTFLQRYTADGSNPSPEQIWDFGFRPSSAVTTSGADTLTTNLTWTQLPLQPAWQLTSIKYPDASADAFYYECSERKQLPRFAFDPFTGKWMGFLAGFQGTWPPPPPPATMVDRMVVKDAGGTNGTAIVFARVTPDWVAGTSGASWSQQAHQTTIYTFPGPTATGTYRAVRLTHPSYAGPSSGTWGAPGATEAEMRNAYLFTTSAIVQAQYFYGSGITSTSGSACETWNESGTVTPYRTVTSQGWDVRSWANPAGTIGTDLPVIPTVTGVTTYEPNLPTRVKVLGAGSSWDAWGPTQVDTGATTPSTGSLSGTSTGSWGGGSLAPSATINQTTKTTRSWNSSLLELQSTQVVETLNGSALSTLRSGATAPLTASTTATQYDSLGRVKQLTQTVGTMVVTEVRTYTGSNPQPDDSTISVTDGGTPLAYSGQIGKHFTYSNDSYLWVTGETDKLSGLTTSYQRDALGRIKQLTDPHGIVTTISYDNWGRAYQVIRAATAHFPALTTTCTYDLLGTWSKEVATDGTKTFTTTKSFDAFGRLTKITNPDGSHKDFTYTGFGERFSETPWERAGQSYPGTTWTYDSKGRVTKVTDAKGRTVLTMPSDPAWDSTLNRVVAKVIDDRSYTTTHQFDLLGQRTTLIDAKGQTTAFTFDKFGRMIQTNQSGQLRSRTFNDLGWLTSRTEPEEGATNLSAFTAWGLPTIENRVGRDSTLPSQVLKTYLDTMGRPTKVNDETAAKLTRLITYDPNRMDVVTQVSETQVYGSIQENYGYDDLFRLTSRSFLDDTGQSFLVSRTFDGFGNITGLTYPAGDDKAARSLGYTYDTGNRLTDVIMGTANRGHLGYNATVTATTYSDLLTLGNGATTSLAFDRGELSQMVHSAKASSAAALSAIESNAYTWTAGGLLTARGQDTFGYDELGRLISSKVFGLSGDSVSQTFTYDPFGNRNSSTATASTGVLPTGVLGQWSATFDTTNSIPKQIAGASGALDTGVTYDNFGRIQSIFGQPGTSGASTQINWTYDPAGRVVAENGSFFLLDADGLRFRRLRSDGSYQYVVYGFDRDPLSTFETAPNTALAPIATSPATKKAAPRASRQGRKEVRR